MPTIRTKRDRDTGWNETEYEIRRKSDRHKRQLGRDYLINAVGICFAKLVLCLSLGLHRELTFESFGGSLGPSARDADKLAK